MKNKKWTYILLGVVAIIWFQVFVRVKSNFTNDTSEIIQNQSGLTNFRIIERDTFRLVADYRDPFGSASQISINSFENASIDNIHQSIEPRKVDVSWPKIRYYGLVRKTDSNNPLGIINIDGMLLHLRKGETIFDDIKIISVGRDSIKVKYHNKTKTFWRD